MKKFVCEYHLAKQNMFWKPSFSCY